MGFFRRGGGEKRMPDGSRMSSSSFSFLQGGVGKRGRRINKNLQWDKSIFAKTEYKSKVVNLDM